MRKAWFAAWAAAGMATANAGPASAATAVGATATGVNAAPTATWTEKVKAPFKKSFAKIAELKPSSPRPVQPIEPAFDPDKATPELFVGLAQMSHRNGNVAQSRQLYQKALAKDPRHLDALLGAARMEDREGQLDVALMLYQRAATAHPQDATALNDLALCHARRGELPIAHHVLEQAVRCEPRNALYRNNVAKVLVELNGLAPAMQHLSAVHPPAAANYNMAVLLSERGSNDEAAQYLSQAIAIDPQLEPARAMLAQFSAPIHDAGQLPQALVQAAPTAQASAPLASESILPTPEVVASIPWRPAAAGEPIAYPATDAAPGPTLPPAATSSPAGQMPALLPPVNQP